MQTDGQPLRIWTKENNWSNGKGQVLKGKDQKNKEVNSKCTYKMVLGS